MTKAAKQLEERVWKVAANLERCALGWMEDAKRYKGSRRQWRLQRAEKLMTRAYAMIGLEA